jgi:hypothetical protein
MHLRQRQRRTKGDESPLLATRRLEVFDTVGKPLPTSLEAGVEVNVIRDWLGHADLTTTNRYAEINTKAKEAALRAVEPPGHFGGIPHQADLAVRRIPPQLARLALIVMWPVTAT